MAPANTAEEHVPTDLKVESQLLGPLSVPTQQVYSFDNGIYGFPNATQFALLPAERDGFYWLQSLDLAALTFLLVDPFQFVEDYSVELDSAELSDFLPEAESDVVVLTTLTLPKEEGDQATTNLQGPIALNLHAKRGKQVVIESPFGIRHPIDVSRDPATTEV